MHFWTLWTLFDIFGHSGHFWAQELPNHKKLLNFFGTPCIIFVVAVAFISMLLLLSLFFVYVISIYSYQVTSAEFTQAILGNDKFSRLLAVSVMQMFVWQVCLTSLSDKFVWLVCLASLSDKYVWQVCVTGLYGKFVWLVCLASLPDKFNHLLAVSVIQVFVWLFENCSSCNY